uniref:Uncharacterized protein n=1 Tax=Arundo donax TaxID=35708 RepID=A0A0A9HHE0_ARUDO
MGFGLDLQKLSKTNLTSPSACLNSNEARRFGKTS